MYYCNPSPAKKQLLDTFSYRPQEFRPQDLISMLENISLLTESNSSAAAATTEWVEKKIREITENIWKINNTSKKFVKSDTQNGKYFFIIHSGPEKFKKSKPKNSWNEMNQFHGIYFDIFHFLWWRN